MVWDSNAIKGQVMSVIAVKLASAFFRLLFPQVGEGRREKSEQVDNVFHDSRRWVAMTVRLCIVASAILLLTGCWQSDVGRSYYPSGKIRTEATVRNGLLDGPATMFYESGAKQSEAQYRAGMLDGATVSFYENGVRKAMASYKQGVLHGRSVSWDMDGTIIGEVDFVDGRLSPPKDH